MSEEGIEELVDDMMHDTVVAFNAAVSVGNYKKANALLDVLNGKKINSGKYNKDVMVA